MEDVELAIREYARKKAAEKQKQYRARKKAEKEAAEKAAQDARRLKRREGQRKLVAKDRALMAKPEEELTEEEKARRVFLLARQEKRRIYNQRYYHRMNQEHPEEMKAKRHAYYETHGKTPKIKAYQKAYREAHREDFKRRSREWYKLHKDEVNARLREERRIDREAKRNASWSEGW